MILIYYLIDFPSMNGNTRGQIGHILSDAVSFRIHYNNIIAVFAIIFFFSILSLNYILILMY